jgi:hypothetical protein
MGHSRLPGFRDSLRHNRDHERSDHQARADLAHARPRHGTTFLRTTGPAHNLRGPERPGFIAVSNDAVEFGLSRRPGANPATAALTWQLGISDVDAAIAACRRAGLRFEVIVERPCGGWTYPIIKVQPPNGMEVLLAEQAPSG